MSPVPRLIEEGQRRCEECGRVHDLWWADGEYSWKRDGHVYRPETWEKVAARYGYTPERERKLVGTDGH